MTTYQGSFAFGGRYRYSFKSYNVSDLERFNNIEEISNATIIEENIKAHRVPLLINYRYDITPEFSIGAVLAIDIWKTLGMEANSSSAANIDFQFHSSQFLWERITGQLGVEFLYKFASLFVKLELGYDFYSFKAEDFLINGSSLKVIAEDKERAESILDTTIFNFSGIYTSLGFGLFF